MTQIGFLNCFMYLGSSGKNIKIMVSKFSNVTSYQNIKEEEF